MNVHQTWERKHWQRTEVQNNILHQASLFTETFRAWQQWNILFSLSFCVFLVYSSQMTTTAWNLGHDADWLIQTSRTNQHPEYLDTHLCSLLLLLSTWSRTYERDCLTNSQCCSCLVHNLRWTISIYSQWLRMNVLHTVLYISRWHS